MDAEIVIGAQAKKSWNPAFCDYLSANWKEGIDIDQKSSKYVTEDILRGYWTTKAVWEIFETSHGKPITSSDDDIIKDYIRVWSTLVLIGSPEYINLFRKKGHNDKFFYYSDFTAAPYLDDDPSLPSMLAAFGEHWKKFWPVQFKSTAIMHHRTLDSTRILPIKSCRQLESSKPVSSLSPTRTIIYEVVLDPSCCDFSNTKVVFKVYNAKNPDASRAFAKEVETFDALGRGCKDVIVEYLGSFIQNGKRVVVLEHANGGNLRTFFETHRRPRSKDELIYLWSKLFKLLDALYHLQHLGRSALGIAHRDIKFENILYFKKGKPGAFEFDFKLTDFDTSTPLQKVHDGFSRQDNDGSRTHSAPEASRIREITETKSEQVPINSDTWQLGTVFSEAFICTLWDVDALPGYEERRRKETKSSPDLVNSGSEICFHDGQNSLPCIKVIHQEALLSRAVFDDISEQVAALIEDEMLVPHEGRAGPRQLAHKFKQLLLRIQTDPNITSASPQRSRNEPVRVHSDPTSNGILPEVRASHVEQENLLPQSTRTTESVRESESSVHEPEAHNDLSPVPINDPPQEQTRMTNGLTQQNTLPNCAETSAKPNQDAPHAEEQPPKVEVPLVTANHVDHWRMNKKKGAEIPGALQQIIDELIDRDQVFVIDDAQSMKVHLPDIIRVATAMISLAKKADPDDVELVFTSKPSQIKKKRLLKFKSQTNDLVAQINNRFAENSLPNSTNMESQLGTILERVALYGKKTSVYVLTDGKWNDSTEPGGGVENPIRNLITRLKHNGRNRTAIAIQFIRFGDDKTGSERMAWLDDDLPKSEPALKNFDIVDTRRHDGNVFLLMIGALRRSIDDMK